MRPVWSLLLAILCIGCTHGVFSYPSLRLRYQSTAPQATFKGNLFLQNPNITFLQDFVPPYYQHKYTQAFQKDSATLLARLGYISTPNAPSAHLRGQIRLAFESTPPTLKETKAMLKASGNDYIDPVRVLRMLRAQSTLTLECIQNAHFPCGIQVHVQVLEPVWRANPLDSDPSAHATDEQRYNTALIETLNKLYQQSLQALESALKKPTPKE
ncbi:hypothetical protein ACFOPX_05965 [Helicobacter baculiformis]|uniref:ABC-type transport auxiliary lipoprotein component domain-containing protein n=1 Tax=Helicobacter baculiformis TaxID=427351 RepID=A0ABV7ZLN1_9HELI|nr:hypothetical protein [Helicobacter baculiformis]